MLQFKQTLIPQNYEGNKPFKLGGILAQLQPADGIRGF